MARQVPVASRPSAWVCLPAGAMRTASEAVIDQNTAWAKAMPMRLATSTSKLQATPERPWQAMKTTKTNISRRRRSMERVASIIGSDIRATTQA